MIGFEPRTMPVTVQKQCTIMGIPTKTPQQAASIYSNSTVISVRYSITEQTLYLPLTASEVISTRILCVYICTTTSCVSQATTYNIHAL